MPSDFVRTIISARDSAVREVRIQLPDSLKEAISESLERGKKAGREAATEQSAKDKAQKTR